MSSTFRLMTSSLAIVASLTCASAQAAAPGTLACDSFKTRLSQAIGESGAKVVSPDDQGYRKISSDQSATVYGWNYIAGLRGEITCSLKGEFLGIAAVLNPNRATKANISPAVAVTQLLDLSGLFLVTLSSSSLSAVSFTVKEYADQAYDQFHSEVSGGERDPIGNIIFDFANKKMTGEVTITSSELRYDLRPQG